MKARILLVVLVVLALLTALLSGCLFGGSKSDEGGEGASAGPDGAAPAAKDAGGPPAGGPGGPEAGGPPAGGPGGPEAGGPPAGGPGGPPGAEAGGPPAGGPGGPGGPEAGGPPAGGPGGPGGPEAGGAAAPAGATSRDGINAKHAGKYDEALAIFETNLKTDPKDQLALRGKAWILAEQGKKAEAVPVFEQFIAASKDAKQVKEAKSAIARLK